ncbi:MAG: GlsB/YeaQ/YmgE family stress response membrane protein [Acidobacteriota bacterium]|nr:GlsB/YeaQ/YmgE family stress response membrane protein [Acidobacteriota bacterium]MDE3189446.1 GlsB/YeaQ/YmgE family stress response membrane protein [Acidobacteriota bacterium]
MVVWFILVLALEGLIVGGLARLALPGPDPMSILATIGLGVAGTFLGGIVAWVFLGHAGGIVFAILGATLLLYLHRRFVQRRPLTGPGARQLPPR